MIYLRVTEMKSLGSFIKLTRTALTSDYVYRSKYKFTSKYQALLLVVKDLQDWENELLSSL